MNTANETKNTSKFILKYIQRGRRRFIFFEIFCHCFLLYHLPVEHHDIGMWSKLLKGFRKQTFRFVPFPLVSPFLSAPFPFAGGAFSLGLTVKNPSRRPCCLLFRYFWSFSAPFRTRSSLNTAVREWAGKASGETHLNPFSVTRNWTSPSTSGFFHSSWKVLRFSELYFNF